LGLNPITRADWPRLEKEKNETGRPSGQRKYIPGGPEARPVSAITWE
jgi:hypothetical protein